MLGDNPAVSLGYGSLQSLRQSKQDYHSSHSGGEVLGAACLGLCGCFQGRCWLCRAACPAEGTGRPQGLGWLSRGSHSGCPSRMRADPICKAPAPYSSPRKIPSPESRMRVGWRQPSWALSQSLAGPRHWHRSWGRTRGASSAWAARFPLARKV